LIDNATVRMCLAVRHEVGRHEKRISAFVFVKLFLESPLLLAIALGAAFEGTEDPE
jgi:hypothetical protein